MHGGWWWMMMSVHKQALGFSVWRHAVRCSSLWSVDFICWIVVAAVGVVFAPVCSEHIQTHNDHHRVKWNGPTGTILLILSLNMPQSSQSILAFEFKRPYGWATKPKLVFDLQLEYLYASIPPSPENSLNHPVSFQGKVVYCTHFLDLHDSHSFLPVDFLHLLLAC